MYRTLLLLPVLGLAVSCGTRFEKANKNSTLQNKGEVASAQNSVLGAPQMLEIQTGEAIDASVSGEGNANGFALNLWSETGANKDLNLTKTCAVQENGALVSISHEFERNKSKELRNLNFINKISGKGIETRLWKKQGETISCVQNHANIKPNDVVFMKGVILELNIENTRSREFVITNKKNGKSIDLSSVNALKGFRNIEWLDANNDGTNYNFKKKVIINTTRAITAKNISGTNTTINFNLATKTEKPLLIEVIKDANTQMVKTKTIAEGILVSKFADNSLMETEFSQFTIERDADGEFSAKSGGFVISYIDSTGQTTKKINCVSDASEISCVDSSSGEEVEAAVPDSDPTGEL